MNYNVSWSMVSPQEYLAYYPHLHYLPLQQDVAYGEAMAQLGNQVVRQVACENNQPIALVQMLRRKVWKWHHLTVCFRGPVWLGETQAKPELVREAMISLRKSIRTNWRRSILWMPEEDTSAHALKDQKDRCVMSGYSTALLDLTCPLDALLQQMDGKWRNRLKAAEKQGLTLTDLSDDPSDYRFLLEEEDHQRKRQHYLAVDPMFTMLVDHHAPDARILCLCAQQGQERCAAMLFLLHGPTATYQIGWSNAHGKAAHAHNLLLWEAIKRLKKRGVRALDLGGLNSDDAPGLARFKLGSGATALRLPGSFAS